SSNKSDDQKAIEKNKVNNAYIDDLNKQIEKDKKALAVTADENEKKKLRDKILVEEDVKRKKEAEIEANNNALKQKGFNEELSNTVTDKVNKNSELSNNTEVNKQVKKTNTLKEEINQLEIKKASANDPNQKDAFDKQINDKKNALYKEEEKLAETIKTENDRNFTEKDNLLDEKLDKTLIKDENKTVAKNLSIEAENDKKEADRLFAEAKNEQDPDKRNEKLEKAVEKQNDAIKKQNDALTVIETNDTRYLAVNENNTNNNTNYTNNGNNGNNGNNTNNGNNGNTTNNGNNSTNSIAENTYKVNPVNYTDPGAQKELDAIKSTLDNIQNKQTEINALRNQAANEAEPGKKAELEKTIAVKQTELAKEELNIAKTFEKINSTEIANNRNTLNQLIAKVDPEQLNEQQKNNFTTAKELFSESANDAAKADALRIKANDETDVVKKNNLLKEANELEKSAIRKQKEAEKSINTTLSDVASSNGNNSNNGSNTNNTNPVANLSEQDKATLNEVSPDYNKKLDEIKNSNLSELRKTQAENELNKEAVNNIESEINKLQSDPNQETLSEEEKRKRKLRIEELNRLLDAKKAELGITEEKLRSANVIANNNQSNKNDYNKTLVVNDKAALAEKSKIDKTLNEIAAEKTKLNEVRIKMAETTAQKEQEKLDKEAKAIENKIVQKEITIAPSIEKINDLEYNAHKANLSQRQLKVTEDGLKLDGNSENKLKTFTAEADNLQKQADGLRDQASKEKDPAKKNDLLKQAHQKETDAIRKLMEAEKVFNDAKLEAERVASNGTSSNTVSENKAKNDAVIRSVDNNYTQNVKDIEASNESPLNKTLKKEALNEELVKKITEEKLALEKNYSNESEEERERRRLRLEELNRILDAKQKELDAQKALLAANGISAGNNDKGSYTDPYPVKNASSKSLLLEAQKRIDELKREEAKLNYLEINRAEATSEADKKKFDAQIKTQQKLVT
ncbi:MAG TPA: hypothetical protein VD905_16495, partial [Flavobacteriales bacterium]|nr:hypothetical protein [Flavobacteriales bacterium]